MKLIPSFLGRRQFLLGSMASASALAITRLAGGNGMAMASEGAGKPGLQSGAATKNPYPHLLSPLRVGNKILKNRILHTPSPPHSLQGPENYPADAYRAHYSEMAKNAAMVTLVEHFGPYPKTWPAGVDNGMVHYSDSMWEDIPPVYNYLQQMVEEVHCEGGLVCCGRLGQGAHGGPGGPGAKMEVTLEDVVTQAKKFEDRGYDAVEVGERDWEGVAGVPAVLKWIEAVKKATNLIIVAVILPFTPGKSRGNPHYPVDERTGDKASGPEMAEVLAMVKLLDGYADILRMKDTGHYTNHPNSFTMERDNPFTLPFAEAIKKTGTGIIVCPTGGFHDPALNEGFIAAGKADMVGMATPLIADPQYVQKACEGRGEDIVPCVKCHSCHGISRTEGPWFDTCSVNPKWGLSETKKRSIRPPTAVKKVAVIGGGPSGMKAALTAAERGHRVTLYEKSDALGGLLRHTDYTAYKWGYRDFKDYLIRQTKKAGIEVLLNTDVTPGMIRAKGYDTVLAALGAAPVFPRIPGSDGERVFGIMEGYRNMKSLGKRVVLIGGGTFGTETGICLAMEGIHVTVLTGGKELIPKKDIGPHNMENQIDLYENHPNFSYVLSAIPTRISGGEVTYQVGGAEKTIEADSVILYAGLKPRMDEAFEFSGTAGQVLLLGDCTGRGGTVQKTIRSAFFTASQV